MASSCAVRAARLRPVPKMAGGQSAFDFLACASLASPQISLHGGASDYSNHMPRTTAAAPKIVGARELKTRLGKYLRAVQSGATITVTERGVLGLRAPPLGRARRLHAPRGHARGRAG